jgi:hypothetical protein
MYFFAKYVNGSYQVSEVGFPTAELAAEAAEKLELQMGFIWVIVHFPRYQHVAAA